MDSAVLPKCPVPSLTHTFDRYLDYVKVEATEEELETSKLLIQHFLSNQGPDLQKDLLELAERTDNWVNEFWMDDMYLNNRLSLPGYSNAISIYPEWQNEPGNIDQVLRYASALVTCVLEYKSRLDNGKIPQEFLPDGTPLCSAQNFQTFRCYREPSFPFDKLLFNHTHDGPDQHIVVLCRNKQFVVHTVVGGTALAIGEIYRQLKSVVEAAVDRTDDVPVSVLTAAHRDDAATAAGILMQDGQNEASMRWIRSCSFILCLDLGCEKIKATEKAERMAARALHVMLGGGPDNNGSNRWYEKTLQWVVADNGVSGMNSEHTSSDGAAWIPLQHEMLDSIQNYLKTDFQPTSESEAQPKLLKFNTPPAVEIILRQIKHEFHKVYEDMQLQLILFDDFGRNYAKSKQCSPDAFIQVMLQLAFFKLHGRLCSTYESAATTRFLQGRVDNIRAATSDALKFSKLMNDLAASKEEKLAAFFAAVKKQAMIQKENIYGLGIDNHMAALKYLSIKADPNNQPAPLFLDPVYERLFAFPLATSSVATKMPMVCYPPMVDDGYGCAYIPSPDSILFAVSARKSSEATNIDQFTASVTESLRELKKLLD